MAVLDTIAERIIKEQELVIGPLAWSEAQKVSGLQVAANHSVTIENSDPKAAVDQLVAQYERLFGKASHEVCRDAVKGMLAGLAPADVPVSLR